MRKKLRNDNFSIICSNCIGGVIYHRLGKQFLSPTINLWMNQKDFLKMALDLKSYMSKELAFIKGEYDYPIALLGDVKVYFNHAKTEEEARHSWEQRKTRINYDNLYVIMYDRDGLLPHGLELLLTRYKFSLISAVTVIWRSVWVKCSAFIFSKTLTILISQLLLPSFGEDGIFLSEHGSGITCISRWEAVV